MGILDVFKKQKEKNIENKENATEGGTINYQNLIKKYPWIIEENQNVILNQ